MPLKKRNNAPTIDVEMAFDDSVEVVDLGFTGLGFEHSDNSFYMQEDWTGETVLVHPKNRKKPANIATSAVNLLNTIVGAGILSMAMAVYKLGLVISIFLVIFIAVITYITMVMLSAVGARLLENQSFISIDRTNSVTPSLGRPSMDPRASTDGTDTSRESQSIDGRQSMDVAVSRPVASTEAGQDSSKSSSDPQNAPSPANAGSSSSPESAAANAGGAVGMVKNMKEVGTPRVTFPWVARQVRPWMLHLLNASMVVLCYGVCVAYLSVISETIIVLVDDLSGSSAAAAAAASSSISGSVSSVVSDGVPAVLRVRQLWIAIAFVVIAPFTFLKRLNSLKYLSYLNMFCVLYLLVMMVIYFVLHFEDVHASNVPVFPKSASAIGNMSLIVFAYACQINFYATFDEISEPKKRHSNWASFYAILGAFIVYSSFGFLGSYACGDHVRSNVMASFPASDWYVIVGRFAIIIDVSCGFPLLFHPFRTCVQSWCELNEKFMKIKTERARRCIVAAVLLVLIFAVAMAFTDLGLILNLTGCTGGSLVSFILPCLIYWLAFPEKKKSCGNITAMIILIFGVVFMVAGVIIVIIDYVRDN